MKIRTECCENTKHRSNEHRNNHDGLHASTSDKDPKISILTASTNVVIERDRLAVVGEILNTFENSGIKGCTQ